MGHYALADARSQLTLARTEMHTFDPARVDGVIQTGLKVVADVDRAGEGAVAELAFRRRGLAWSLAAILLFVVALALKSGASSERYCRNVETPPPLRPTPEAGG